MRTEQDRRRTANCCNQGPPEGALDGRQLTRTDQDEPNDPPQQPRPTRRGAWRPTADASDETNERSSPGEQGGPTNQRRSTGWSTSVALNQTQRGREEANHPPTNAPGTGGNAEEGQMESTGVDPYPKAQPTKHKTPKGRLLEREEGRGEVEGRHRHNSNTKEEGDT